MLLIGFYLLKGIIDYQLVMKNSIMLFCVFPIFKQIVIIYPNPHLNHFIGFCPTLSSTKFCGGNINEKTLNDIWINSKFFNHIRMYDVSIIMNALQIMFVKVGVEVELSFSEVLLGVPIYRSAS